jgi:threonylcarbamoyladenosine tRNA methylthiotransferase MtaB
MTSTSSSCACPNPGAQEKPRQVVRDLPSVCVVNLGCRVNRVESDWMEEALSREGFALSQQDSARVIVINSCAVTGEAQAKTRHAVRQAAARAQVETVAVTGCAAALFPEELSALSPKVRLLPSKLTVASDLLELLGSLPSPDAPRQKDSSRHLVMRARRGIKVQDGCDNRCTYCIVWRARGKSVSIDLDTIDSQVDLVLSEGAAEIDLTGVNLGRFRARIPGSRASSHAEMRLAGLVDRVASRARGHAMVRASSLEPQDVDDDILQSMAKNSDVVCPHLHLPLQSGCDETLGRMGRPYRVEQFAEIVSRARSLMPAFSLTTDVIVGFPGETDDEFEQSLEFCRKMAFSKMHVFRYSRRPGTPAASMPNQVNAQTLRERSERMRKLARQMRLEDARSRIGTQELALVERFREDGIGVGSTASYHDVVVEGAGEVLSTHAPASLQPQVSLCTPGALVPYAGLFLVDIRGADETGTLRAQALSCVRLVR